MNRQSLDRRILARPGIAVVALAATNLLSLLALGFLGEMAARWHTEGSLRLAMASIIGRRSPLASYDTANWIVPDPELGYKLNPANPGINSFGVRHPPINPIKPVGAFRLVVLGDSVAWDTNGFVDILRAELEHRSTGSIEVINASVPGYTTYQERRFFERDLARLSPDLIVLEYCLNDNHQFLHFLNGNGRWLIMPEVARTFPSDDPNFLQRVASSSYLWFEVQQRLLSFKLAPHSRFPWEDRPDLRTAWIDATWTATREHLIALRRATEQFGGRFVVVAVPIELQLRPDLLAADRSYVLKPQTRLQAICEEVGIPFLDLFPAFAAHDAGDALFRDGLHLAPTGHALAAVGIERFLAAQRLLPGKSFPPG